MPTIHFTPNLARHVDCPTLSVEAATVAEALEAAFAERPRLKGYVLDDRGALRRHMVVFVDGLAVRDRRTLADPVPPGAEIYVMQALSGG